MQQLNVDRFSIKVKVVSSELSDSKIGQHPKTKAPSEVTMRGEKEQILFKNDSILQQKNKDIYYRNIFYIKKKWYRNFVIRREALKCNAPNQLTILRPFAAQQLKSGPFILLLHQQSSSSTCDSTYMATRSQTEFGIFIAAHPAMPTVRQFGIRIRLYADDTRGKKNKCLFSDEL